MALFCDSKEDSIVRKVQLSWLSLFLLIGLPAGGAEDGSAVKRMPSGKPDLSGTYDAGTVTPVDRPPQFGNNLYLAPEEAKKLEETSKEFWQAADRKSEGERQAPPVGGDGNNMFGGGGVGGYNAFQGPRRRWSTGSSVLRSSTIHRTAAVRR